MLLTNTAVRWFYSDSVVNKYVDYIVKTTPSVYVIGLHREDPWMVKASLIKQTLNSTILQKRLTQTVILLLILSTLNVWLNWLKVCFVCVWEGYVQWVERLIHNRLVVSSSPMRTPHVSLSRKRYHHCLVLISPGMDLSVIYISKITCFTT